MFAKKSKNQRRRADQPAKSPYSYYSNNRLRSDDQAERARVTTQKQKDRAKSSKGWWHHTPSIIALVVILICLGFALSINTDPKIVVSGNNQNLFIRDKAVYQVAAYKIINQSIFNRSKLTFNTDSVSQQLKQQFPELAQAAVTIPLVNRRPVIYIRAGQPSLVLVSQDKSTLVDDRGVAVMAVGQAKNLTKYKLVTVKDESGIEVKNGQSILPSTDVKFMLDSAQQFAAQGLKVDEFILPARANELNAKLSGQKYLIKMDMQGDSREQVGAYLAAKDKLNSSRTVPAEYIDVRVSGRVFYK